MAWKSSTRESEGSALHTELSVREILMVVLQYSSTTRSYYRALRAQDFLDSTGTGREWEKLTTLNTNKKQN